MKMGKLHLWVTAVTMSTAFSACTKRKLGTFAPAPAESGVSEISMNLPDKDTLKGPNSDKMNGYRLIVEPLEEDCDKATRIDRTELWESTRLEVSLQQGCSYSIGVMLGHVSAGRFGDAYYSNYKGPKQGQQVCMPGS